MSAPVRLGAPPGVDTPTALAVAAGSGDVEVGGVPNTFTVINGPGITSSTAVPGDPDSVTFDLANGEFVRALRWTAQFGFVSTGGAIPLLGACGLYPSSIGFDTATGNLFVVNWAARPSRSSNREVP